MKYTLTKEIVEQVLNKLDQKFEYKYHIRVGQGNRLLVGDKVMKGFLFGVDEMILTNDIDVIVDSLSKEIQIDIDSGRINEKTTYGVGYLKQAHYDKDGKLEGGAFYVDDKIVGHIDPSGPKGVQGEHGITSTTSRKFIYLPPIKKGEIKKKK